MSVNITITRSKSKNDRSFRRSTSKNEEDRKLLLLPSPRYPPSPSRVDKDEEGSESQQVTFSVKGMVCTACAGSIEKAIKRLPGIKDAFVAVLQNRAQVVYNPDVVQEEIIREAIEDAGFEASIMEDFGNCQELLQSSSRRVQRLQVTVSFSECSKQVWISVWSLFPASSNRPDLAEVLQAVQAQEKQKLHIMATLQVLRRAGRPSERAHALEQGHQETSYTHGPLCSHGPESEINEDSGLEMAQLEAEYDAAIKEATGLVQDAVLEINDHIEVVRYEIEELEQKRESVLAQGDEAGKM